LLAHGVFVLNVEGSVREAARRVADGCDQLLRVLSISSRAKVLRLKRRRRHLQCIIPLQQKRSGGKAAGGQGTRRKHAWVMNLSSVEARFWELSRQTTSKDPVPELSGLG
jgi:hypothetical protein